VSWLDDLIGLKPNVPFLELPSFKHEEEPLENRTHEFLRRLFPSKKRIFKTFDDGKNHWIQRQLIVYGGPGTGKTEFFKWLVLKAVEKYGRDDVKAYMARGDLEALLKVEYPPKPVILLYDDDATLEKLNKETVKVFTRIRHKCMEDTGLDNGLVVTVTGLHRFHASNPLIRTNFNLLVVRNPPAGKYDHDFLAFYIGKEGLHYLEHINDLRMKDESYLGHAVFANPSSGIKGVVTNNLVNEKSLGEVLEIIETQSSEREEYEIEDDWKPIPLKSWHDPEFLNEIVDELKLKRSSPRIAERDREIFLLSLNPNETTDTIAAKHGITPTRVGQIIRRIKRAELGYAAERAYHKRHPDWEYHGGNSPLPDFIDHTNKRVISFKAYIDSELTPKSVWITRRTGEEEKRYALEHGYTLEMHVYELCNRNFYTFILHKKKKQNTNNAFPTPPIADPARRAAPRDKRG